MSSIIRLIFVDVVGSSASKPLNTFIELNLASYKNRLPARKKFGNRHLLSLKEWTNLQLLCYPLTLIRPPLDRVQKTMPTSFTPGDVASILAYLIPGFIALSVRSQFVTTPHLQNNERLLSYLTISITYNVLVIRYFPGAIAGLMVWY